MEKNTITKGHTVIAAHYMETIQKYVRRLMNESKPNAPIWNIESIKLGKEPHWNYIDGCMMTSLINLYYETQDPTYLSFVDHFVDYYVESDGSIRGFKKDDYNLDNINEGRILFDLYALTGKEKYRKGMETLMDQLRSHPRTKEGNFWHKAIYPNQIWLDGLYMAQPFYIRYAMHYDKSLLADSIHQFESVYRLMFDVEHELYYHGYDASKTAFWANKKSGLSQNFWLRAIGWYTVALIDAYDFLGAEQAQYQKKIGAIYRRTIDGILRYLDRESSMFYQVPNLPNQKGNYLETSGSCMVSYAILKGARLGLVEDTYRAIGLQIFNGVCRKYLSLVDDKLDLGGICLVAGLGPENNPRRDGSFDYYISEPVVKNDAKGVGPFIMAFTEVKRIYE